MTIGTPQALLDSEPGFFDSKNLLPGQMIVNMGPQHPSTHGVLRLEALTDGELILDVVPHIGYLHRCFEKHAESLPFSQVIPFVDRMDYVAAINSEWVYCRALERMLGLEGKLHPRTEYIRVLVAELNRIASHCIAIGTYGLDIGAFTPFLYLMEQREHILRLLEWASGARLLYNYIWVGGLFYDLPLGFEKRCREFINQTVTAFDEVRDLMVNNHIFIGRTANIGVLRAETAVAYAATGPVLRASGVGIDERAAPGFSVYPEMEFDVIVGRGLRGTVGDCWDRNWVRLMECYESFKIIHQCLDKLSGEWGHSQTYDPQEFCPKKIRPAAGEFYFSGETPRGELGFFFKTDGKTDIAQRCKVRSPCFVHLSLLQEISRGNLLADLIAIGGSLDLVMGEVDR